MKKVEAQAVEQESAAQEPHFLHKQHLIVSKKTVDYNNLTAFEAVSMSAVFVLAVLVGVVSTTVA